MEGGRAVVSPIWWRFLNPHRHKWVWETLSWCAQSRNHVIVVPTTDISMWCAQSCNQFIFVPTTDISIDDKQIQFTLLAMSNLEKHKKQIYCSMASEPRCYKYYIYARPPVVEMLHFNITSAPAPIARLLMSDHSEPPGSTLLCGRGLSADVGFWEHRERKCGHSARLDGRHDRRLYFPLSQLRLARLWKCNGYRNEISKSRTPEMIELNAFVGVLGEFCSFWWSRVEVEPRTPDNIYI